MNCCLHCLATDEFTSIRFERYFGEFFFCPPCLEDLHAYRAAMQELVYRPLLESLGN